ncbi:YitT family protein [Candidatus Phytoplasma oryzae]|nr:YitT family protein [Candidatus Phytoplasma oryzae]
MLIKNQNPKKENRKDDNMKNIKKKIFLTSIVLFSITLTFFLIYNNLIIFKKYFQINFFKFLLSISLLIFNVYFFILPENFIIGGLESNLIFLDKFFFFNKKSKKQEYFFSKNNNIILIRIIIISIFGYLMKDVKYFFINTVIINLFFSFVIKILEYYKIKRNFFINKMPFILKNNDFLRLFFFSLIIGINVGISCGFILLNNGSTGGTDVIFAFIKKIFKLNNLKAILLMTDGIIIIFSFYLDWKRKIDKKQKIFMKYIFSLISFIIAVLLIDIILNKK